jgi:membrane protein involved in colicin uptake
MYYCEIQLELLYLCFQRLEERHLEQRTVPESSFITHAQSQMSQSASSSAPFCIRQGELAQKLLQMQQEKDKANEQRKLALLEAKYQAEVNKAEEKAKKKLEQDKKKAELAMARAKLAAEKKEKKRQEAEVKKKAAEETRRIITEVRKEVVEKKKKEAAEKRELAKLLTAENKRKAKRDAKLAAENAQRETHEAELIVQRAMMAANAPAEEGPLPDAQVPQMHGTRTETIPMDKVVTEAVPSSRRLEWYLGVDVGSQKEAPNAPDR